MGRTGFEKGSSSQLQDDSKEYKDSENNCSNTFYETI